MTSVAILAGGLATRLRPITEKFPKALIDINGVPFIDYQLNLLIQHGLRDFVLCLGFEGTRIEEHLGDGSRFGASIRYSYDGPVLVGTGGALRQALPMLSDPFLVTYGDAFLRTDYQNLLAHYRHLKDIREPGPLALMTVYRNEGLFDKSNVIFDQDKILRYDKFTGSQAMHHIDWGVGILDHAAFRHAPDEPRFDLAVLYMTLVAQDRLAGYEVAERFYEIGSFEGLESFRALGVDRPTWGRSRAG